MVTDDYTSSQYDQLFRREGAARYVQETYGFPCSPQTLAKLAIEARDSFSDLLNLAPTVCHAP